MDAVIDARRDEHGVEPICRELTDSGIKIAPNGYDARKNRQPSAPARTDAIVDGRLSVLHRDNMDFDGEPLFAPRGHEGNV